MSKPTECSPSPVSITVNADYVDQRSGVYHDATVEFRSRPGNVIAAAAFNVETSELYSVIGQPPMPWTVVESRLETAFAARDRQAADVAAA